MQVGLDVNRTAPTGPGAVTTGEADGREDQIACRILLGRGIGNLCRLAGISRGECVLPVDLPIQDVKRRVRQKLHMARRWGNLRFSDRYVIRDRWSSVVKSSCHLRICTAAFKTELKQDTSGVLARPRSDEILPLHESAGATEGHRIADLE